MIQTWESCKHECGVSMFMFVTVDICSMLQQQFAHVCLALVCGVHERGHAILKKKWKKSIIQQSIYHNFNINDGFPMVTLTTPKNTQSINQWRLHFQLIFCSFKLSFSISSSKYTHILLWCLYYLFRLSFWQLPFTEVDLWIVSISPNLLRWRINLIYVLDCLRVSKCSAIFHF